MPETSEDRARIVHASLKQAYRLMEEGLGRMKAPRGEKADLVAKAVIGQKGPFRIIDIETALEQFAAIAEDIDK